MYVEWGFTEPPFQTASLGANERGNRLLVGRDSEVGRFEALLASPPRAVTVEGANGVGKTSLVNVAIYRAMARYLNTGEGTLFVPALEPLQIAEDVAIEPFLDQVYSLLARTLIQRAREIRGFSWELPNTQAINEWINSPLIERLGGGVGPVNVQRTADVNDTVGYARGGFRAEIRDWLQAVFPAVGGGGLVCLIDNLELLRTSARARQLVETLRDPLFGIPGVRWVLCGANGITRSVAGSPRLDGYLHAPIDVEPLGDQEAFEIFRSRISAYRRQDLAPYLPLREEDFVALFEILAANTRSVLRYADTFCTTQFDHLPQTADEKAGCFRDWINRESRNCMNDCAGHVGNRAWQLFDQVCREGRDFAPGEFARFGFNSQPVMVPHVGALEESGLVVSAIDETDRRRRTVSVTPKGWLVRFARMQERAPEP